MLTVFHVDFFFKTSNVLRKIIINNTEKLFLPLFFFHGVPRLLIGKMERMKAPHTDHLNALGLSGCRLTFRA